MELIVDMASRTKVIMFHLLCFLIGFVGVVCGQTDCDHELIATNISATLTSPNFPSNYPDNLRCVIHIRSPTGSRIELNFTTFELEDSVDCAKDSLVIYNANDGGDRLLFHSCGTTWIWPRFPDGLVETSGSEATVVFVTDSSVSARGFSFEYRCIQTPPEVLFFTAETRIRYIYRHNAGNGYFDETSMMNVSAVDFDPSSGFLFYGDSGARQISRRNILGTAPSASEVIVTDVDPFGFRLDIPSRLLYWTDATLRTVSVTDLDGTHRSNIISDLGHPGAIVVEPYKGYIYYTDMGSPVKLERADGDGGNRVILAQGLGQGLYNTTTALAIDLEDRVLYWIDSSLGRLYSVRYDGSGRQFLSSAYTDENPFALVIDSYAFIFTDPTFGRLRFDSRDFTVHGPSLKLNRGSTYYKGLTLRSLGYTGEESNVCPNSACSGLCLPKPNDQYRCVTDDPAVVCPDNIDTYFNSGQFPSVQVTWAEPAGIVVSSSKDSGDFFPEGVTTVTYFLLVNGAIETCTFTVTVTERDTTPPVFVNCPTSREVWVGPGQTSSRVTWDTVRLQDPNDVILSTSVPSGSVFYLGTMAVTILATDNDSNVATCRFTVTVRADSQPPIIRGCPSDITVGLSSPGTELTVFWVEPTVTDNFGTPSWVVRTKRSGSEFPVGETVVTYLARDSFGNTAQCVFTVKVTAYEAPPVFRNCPVPITVWIAPGTTSKRITWDTITVEDPNGVMIRSTIDSGSQFYVGTESVHVEAFSSNSDSAWCNFTVTIRVDDIPPAISQCPANITIDLTRSSERDVVVTWVAPSVTDNVSDADWTEEPIPGTRFPIGTSEVTYTATDDFNNLASCTFYVTVNGVVVPPVFRNCPGPMMAWIGPGETTKRVLWDTITLDDPEDIIVSSSLQSGSEFFVGTETVYVEATDPSSLIRAWCNFTVTIRVDDIPPVISQCPANITISLVGKSEKETVVNWAEPEATDNSDGENVLWMDSPSPRSFSVGTSKVTYTVRDSFNNVASCTFYVTVEGDEDRKGDKDKDVGIVVGAAAGGGVAVLLLLLIIVILVLIFRRRRRRAQDDPPAYWQPYGRGGAGTANDAYDDTSIYESQIDYEKPAGVAESPRQPRPAARKPLPGVEPPAATDESKNMRGIEPTDFGGSYGPVHVYESQIDSEEPAGVAGSPRQPGPAARKPPPGVEPPAATDESKNIKDIEPTDFGGSYGHVHKGSVKPLIQND